MRRHLKHENNNNSYGMDKEKVEENYQSFNSDKLIAIVHNLNNDYTAEAVEIARAELKSRGITKIPNPPEQAEGIASKPELGLSVIRVYGDELQAEVARSKLESENIATTIWRDDCGGLRPYLQPRTGIRLVVREEDAETADMILREVESDSPTTA